MKITLHCAYCNVPITFTQSDIKLSHRAGKVTEITCPTCDSVFEVHLDTKRKRKGKRLKQVEAEHAAKVAKALAERRAENAKLGDALLAEPGCTCQELHDRRAETWGARTSDGGHFLSTAWSRDRQLDAMMPTKPQHTHGCPRRAAHEETSHADA